MYFYIIILGIKRLINWLRLKLSSDYKFLNPKEALLFSLRTGNQLKEFDESFPDYNLTFAVYDLNNLIVTVTKRK